MSLHRPMLSTAAMVAALAFTTACGPKLSQGQLAVSLVDAVNPEVEKITVNITRVTAHSTTEGWVTVNTFDPPMTVDLLTLQTVAAPLGLANLPPGKITQIRLLVAKEGNSVTTGGATVPLKVPSGYESGIKIHGPWDIVACNRSSVTLDFDGKKSIHYHPAQQGAEWILRPVIRVGASSREDVGCEETPSGDEAPAGEETAGSPPSAGAGSPCSAGAECLSGVCTTNTCAAGGPGTPCVQGTDCASGSCTAEGDDKGTCAAGTAQPPGALCTANVECLSNACDAGTCGHGGQGTPCKAASDCDEGLSCIASTCDELSPAL
jgi:Domain of unknown function (DUF4382)